MSESVIRSSIMTITERHRKLVDEWYEAETPQVRDPDASPITKLETIVKQDKEALAKLLANFEREALTLKEQTVAEHIKQAALDGCMCEPCIAVRSIVREVRLDQLRKLLNEHSTIIEDEVGGWEVVHTRDIEKCIAALEGQKGR